ncbi:MAG: hypothetical protein MUE85_21330 [Microscillaceae bacterium]|nr:hypothetical protein [Microscillaceae bacterium]
MDKQFKQTSGFCLLLGSFLLVITMVLHPSGGSLLHILKISRVIISAHTLAIISLPLVGFGFYGFTVALLDRGKISIFAFILIVMSLVAAMLAASINGLMLPLFVGIYAQELESQKAILLPIVRYGSVFNQAMDYILIGAMLSAIGVWSVLLLRLEKFPRWLGMYGLALLASSGLGMVVQFDFIDLFGFRVFIFSLMSWVMLAGLWLIIKREDM